MNYLLEDIFRRADTWRGRDQHGMGPSGIGQQQRVFLHPEATAANGNAHTFSGVKTGFDVLDTQLYNRGWPIGGCIEVISQCSIRSMASAPGAPVRRAQSAGRGSAAAADLFDAGDAFSWQ